MGRKKVEAYIRANQNHVAIAKLRRNLSLTETDLTALEEMLFTTEGLESREKFLHVHNNTAQNLKSFIRTLVGLDRAAAKEAFGQYLEAQQFSANQIRFVEQIIDLLTQQVVMNLRLLYAAPFTDFHQDGLDGVFGDHDADSIVAIVRSFNHAVSGHAKLTTYPFPNPLSAFSIYAANLSRLSSAFNSIHSYFINRHTISIGFNYGESVSLLQAFGDKLPRSINIGFPIKNNLNHREAHRRRQHLRLDGSD